MEQPQGADAILVRRGEVDRRNPGRGLPGSATGSPERRQRFRPFLAGIAVVGMAWLSGGCGGGGGTSRPLPPGTVPDAAARAASASTMPTSPVQITFGYRLREADLRFNGRGVARIQPPYRVRIDLFSSQGEGLFRAALVGSDLRVPPGVPRELAPPPALLWAAVGVFRPDADLHLLDGRLNGEGNTVLRYEGPGQRELRFTLADDRLVRAEIRETGHVIEEVDLKLDENEDSVVETVYRNHPLFLELTFSLESVETVDSFPWDIWYPGG